MSFKYLFKFVVIGDASCGKTSYCLRLTDNQFFCEKNNTVGVEFSAKIFTVEGVKVKCQFWDTAGCERFRSITRSYYRGVTAIILVFDLSRRSTFVSLLNWRKEIEQNAESDVPVLLVGAKSDKEIKVDNDEIRSFAEANGYVYTEVSSKTGHNVVVEFHDFLIYLLKNCTNLQPWKSTQPTKVEQTDTFECCKIQ